MKKPTRKLWLAGKDRIYTPFCNKCLITCRGQEIQEGLILDPVVMATHTPAPSHSPPPGHHNAAKFKLCIVDQGKITLKFLIFPFIELNFIFVFASSFKFYVTNSDN